MNVVASPDGLALLTLIQNASLPVKLVIALLMAASFISWTMIFRKWFTLKSAYSAASRFETRFWSGGNLVQMYNEFAAKGSSPTGMESLFVDGFREYKRLVGQPNMQPMEVLAGVQRAMRVALTREMDFLEVHLPFLATVGSTSP
ncbi:MAG TPA: protein TolQ, partial [Burkholderiales bacterium]|nr:protein TolQ [Burkholderiales bacterium]